MNFLDLNSGRPRLNAFATTGGGGDANKPAQLNASGTWPVAMIPTGIPVANIDGAAGEDKKAVAVGSDVTAGQYVNLYDDAGTLKCRPADNSNNQPAHGFVKDSVTAGSNVDVWFDGENGNVTPTTVGAEQFLGTSGAITETVPSSSGELVQRLGVALSLSAMETEIAEPIAIA